MALDAEPLGRVNQSSVTVAVDRGPTYLVSALLVARIRSHRLIQVLGIARGVHANARRQISHLAKIPRATHVSGRHTLPLSPRPLRHLYWRICASYAEVREHAV